MNAPDGSDYPLAALSYFIVLQQPGLGYATSLSAAEVLVQWLHWVLTTGQSESSSVEYVNPPSTVVTQDLHAIETMVYSGATIPVCGYVPLQSPESF